jgi:hypothetical protein
MFEVKEFFNPHSKLVTHVLSEEFPWYFPVSTWGQVEAHYHLLLSRSVSDPKIVSEYFYPFQQIFDKFCDENSIVPNVLYSAALHQTLPSTKVAQNFHVDFDFPHKLVIMYLNDDFEAGRTLVTDIIKTSELPMVTADVLESAPIKAENGKILYFDGLRYHAGEYPIGGRRIVCIFAFN